MGRMAIDHETTKWPTKLLLAQGLQRPTPAVASGGAIR